MSKFNNNNIFKEYHINSEKLKFLINETYCHDKKENYLFFLEKQSYNKRCNKF